MHRFVVWRLGLKPALSCPTESEVQPGKVIDCTFPMPLQAIPESGKSLQGTCYLSLKYLHVKDPYRQMYPAQGISLASMERNVEAIKPQPPPES